MKKLFLFFCACVFLLLLSDVSIAQQVETKIDARQITIGDQVRLFVTAEFDTTQSRLVWPQIPDTFNHLEVVERTKPDTLRSGKMWQIKQKLLITGFDSGSFLIPSFAFLHIPKNGVVDSLFSDSFRVDVGTVAVDTNKAFKDIKTIREVSMTWRDYIGWIIALVLGVLVLVFVMVYFRMNKAKKYHISTPTKKETLHEQTMRLLQELEDKQLWQNDKVKDFYTELSLIVREYIEIRFNTPAMEFTTNELLQKAKKHSEMTKFRSSLKPLLRAADLAKFAKAVPLPEEHVEALNLAREFVRVSKMPDPNTTQNTPNK